MRAELVVPGCDVRNVEVDEPDGSRKDSERMPPTCHVEMTSAPRARRTDKSFLSPSGRVDPSPIPALSPLRDTRSPVTQSHTAEPWACRRGWYREVGWGSGLELAAPGSDVRVPEIRGADAGNLSFRNDKRAYRMRRSRFLERAHIGVERPPG